MKKEKTRYVDGFVVAVPTRNKAAYVKMAKLGLKAFAELGALRVVETWADNVPKGKWTNFHRAVKAKKGESIVFSWIEWPTRKVRDAGMKRMMTDPRYQAMFKDMPFDGKRMIYGGFLPLLDG